MQSPATVAESRTPPVNTIGTCWSCAASCRSIRGGWNSILWHLKLPPHQPPPRPPTHYPSTHHQHPHLHRRRPQVIIHHPNRPHSRTGTAKSSLYFSGGVEPLRLMMTEWIRTWPTPRSRLRLTICAGYALNYLKVYCSTTPFTVPPTHLLL